MRSIAYYFKQLHSFAGSRLYLIMTCMVIIGMLEGIGILLLVPLLSMSGIVSFQQFNRIDPNWLDLWREIPQLYGLMLVLSVYLTLIIGQNLLQRYMTIKNVEIQQNYSRKLRIDTYRALLWSEWSFFLRKRTSDLINLLTTELARVMSGIHMTQQFLANILSTAIQIGLVLWISPSMTLFVLVSGAILALFSRKFIKKSRTLGSQSSRLAQHYLAGISDQLHGIKDIKSNNLVPSRLQWLEWLTGETKKEQLTYVRIRMNSQMMYKISSAFLIALFILASFTLFPAQGQYLLIIILVFGRLWPQFTSIQSQLEQIASTIPSFQHILRLRDECLAAQEQAPERTGLAAPEPLPVTRSVEFRDVSFRYVPGSGDYALRHIQLTIPAHQMTAIVGRSGAGKSTLIDLFMGLIEPESGQLIVDGEPITRANLLSYRQSIGYVAQDPFLYHASIRDNLAMVKPDASEEQMWEALGFASAAEFVRKLPQGIDTVIGDRGIRLSGGERQRIVLARAMIRNPSVLVLDEATSALDAENESVIQEALYNLKGKMTIIVVAHRLSTIRHADHIVVVEQGQIIEQGTYNKLVHVRNGAFRTWLGSQNEVRII